MEGEAVDGSRHETTYLPHHATVVAAAYRVLRDRSLAQDVAQEVFIRFWADPEAFGSTHPEIRTHLVVLARSRAIDQLRSQLARRRRERLDSNLTRLRGPLDDFSAVLEAHGIRDALHTLPDEQLRPIVLAYYGGHTYQQIAELLGVPEGTIKSRIRSALRGLRRVLEGPDGA